MRLMTNTVKPRVWVGKGRDTKSYWSWDEFTWLPLEKNCQINCGDIFVPGTAPEPTVDVRDFSTLETCTEVDWE